MKKSLLFLTVALFPNLSVHAWQPDGWVYTTWPYAYEAQSSDWYFILESGTQWVYSYPPGSGAWARIEDCPLTNGWSWYRWPNAHGPETNHWHLLIQTDTQWAANMTTGAWSQFGHPVALDPLLTDEIYVFSTQNGNLNNQGLAVYDKDRKRHLYSVGTSIRAYDPATRATETVLSLENHGRPTFLNIRDDEMYFIEATDGWLLRYNMTSETLEVLKEARHNYAARDQSNLHVRFWQDGYYNTWTLRRLSMNTNSFGSATIPDVEHLNLSSSRYWYTTTDGTTLMLRDAFSGAGQSNVFKLGSRGYTAIHEMVLDPLTAGSHNPLVALILETDETLGLYLLQVTGSDEGEINLVTEAQGGALHSLAYDGTYFTFINGSTDAAIYRAHKETREVEKVIDVPSTAENINFVNHWLYFSEKESALLHRVNPVTRQVETLN
jgi:hypothetical protein